MPPIIEEPLSGPRNLLDKDLLTVFHVWNSDVPKREKTEAWYIFQKKHPLMRQKIIDHSVRSLKRIFPNKEDPSDYLWLSEYGIFSRDPMVIGSYVLDRHIARNKWMKS